MSDLGRWAPPSGRGRAGAKLPRGLLPVILLLLLPFGILWVLIRLLPPWQEEESEGETESQLAPKPEAQVMA